MINIHIHKWSPWTDEEWRLDCLIPGTLVVRAPGQQRICLRCGKVKRKGAKAWG